MIVKLISNNYTIYYQSKIDSTRLVSGRTSTVITPDLGSVRGYVLGFGFLLGEESFPQNLIRKILKFNYCVIYITDHIPSKPLIHPNLIYIVSGWEWLVHTCFLDYQIFSGVFSSGSGKSSRKLATRFLKITPYKCILLVTHKDLEKLNPPVIKDQKKDRYSLLVDTVTLADGRGLGDLLMLTVLFRYLVKQWEIDIYVRPESTPLFQYNPHIHQIISGKSTDVIREIYRCN